MLNERYRIGVIGADETAIKEWLATFDMGLPIDSNEIPDFEHWVNFNGFSTAHQGYDFCRIFNQRRKSYSWFAR